jgi:hypothetical protein
MDYKSRFSGLEQLRHGDWQPLPPREPLAGPTGDVSA